MRQKLIAGAVVVSTGLFAASDSAAMDLPPAFSTEVRALTGTDGPLGPGLGPGISFSVLEVPFLNDTGSIAIRANLAGVGVESRNIAGIWAGGSGGLDLVARLKDPAPGTAPDLTFGYLESPQLTNSGQVIFGGSIYFSVFDPPGPVDITNDQGIWAGGAGVPVELIAREKSAAPGTGTGPTFFQLASYPSINRGGQLAFINRLSGSNVTNETDTGIWSNGNSGELSLVVRQGDSAPGFPAGFRFNAFSRVLIDDNGFVTFQSQVDDPHIGASTNEGIWSERGGNGLSLVVRTGDLAPGTPDGVRFSELFLGGPRISPSGQIAFRAELTGPGVDGTNDRGLWSDAGGNGIELIIRRGDQMPGTAPGVILDGIVSDGVINDAGRIAFIAQIMGAGITGGNNGGVWSTIGGTGLRLIAREGEQAPDTPEGAMFNSFGPVMLGGEEQVAFVASLFGVGVTDPNRSGIWASDPEGHLRLIIRAGDSLNVSTDPQVNDLRTVRSFEILDGSTRDDRDEYGFNEAGQLAYIVRFTDGSEGVFVTTVPEPGTILGVGLVCMLGLGRRRRA